MSLEPSSEPRRRSSPRLHPRYVQPQVVADSPLIDLRLLDLSSSGLGFETSVGLRLGVPYPVRLRDGEQTLSTEAVVRWCRWVRNEVAGGDARPVYRVGAAFVDWQVPEPPTAGEGFERQIDDALDGWISRNRTAERRPDSGRKILHPKTAPRS